MLSHKTTTLTSIEKTVPFASLSKSTFEQKSSLSPPGDTGKSPTNLYGLKSAPTCKSESKYTKSSDLAVNMEIQFA
jgi:hypothetical protein